MEQQQPPSEIQEFYKGQRILLTGITGFIGTGLVEKLVRSCSDIDKIYTIIRPRKGLGINERMKKYFKQSVFDRVREQDPNFASKIVPIKGDLGEPDLGLSPEDRRFIIENVTLIIHNAASVAFYHRISAILKVNVIGTQMMLELASECPRLKAFIYVSTAYSQSHQNSTEEKCYSPPGDLKIVEDIIAADTITERGMTDEALVPLLNNCTTNYTFSKAITEGIVERFSRKASFPCGIFRPSIVYHSCKEPHVGWLATFSGLTTLIQMYGLGYLHFVQIKGPNYPRIDVVPVDMTCNALITCLWDLAVFKKPQVKCYVYHYTSGKLNTATLPYLFNGLKPYMKEKPSIKAAWYPFLIFPNNFWSFFILHCLFHIIPGVLYDLVRFKRGQPLIVIPKLKLLVYNVHSMGAFSRTDFIFEMKEIPEIWARQNETDKKIFYSDIRLLDWTAYCRSGWDSMRTYVFKEGDELLPAARRKHFKLKILHYATCTVLLFSLLYFLYSCVCRLLGL